MDRPHMAFSVDLTGFEMSLPTRPAAIVTKIENRHAALSVSRMVWERGVRYRGQQQVVAREHVRVDGDVVGARGIAGRS
jgi:hypothetical protein